MNTNRRIVATLAIAASLAAGTYFVKQHSQGNALSSVFEADRHLRFAIDLPRGTEYVYDLAIVSKADLHLPALGETDPKNPDGLVHADVDLAGRLALRSHGKRAGNDGAFLVGARFDRLERHELGIFGRTAFADDAAARSALEGHEALVEIDPAGSVRAMHFAKDDPPVFKQVMQAVLTELQVHVLANGDAAWTAPEITQTGRVTSRYDVDEKDPPRLTRTRAAYDAVGALPGHTFAPGEQTLASRATIELDPAGFVSAIASSEEIAARGGAEKSDSRFASKQTVSLRIQEVRPWTVVDVDVAALETRIPGELVSSPDAQKNMLEQQAAGITYEQMESDLAALALGQKLPRGWVMHASGFLKLHPEKCMDVAALFESSKLDARARTEIVDLLASTGTPQAQEAMRVALESPKARVGSVPYGTLLQRFSTVMRPTPASFGFVNDRYAEAKTKDERLAAAYALGGVAGNMRAGGDDARAKQASETLRRDLAQSRDPSERKNLCMALGNVARSEDVPTFADLAKDDSADVRSSAAWALHRIDTPEARATLLDLAVDAEPIVVETAFDAMKYESLDAGDLTKLADAVTRGATPATADGALLGLLTTHTDGGQPVRAMLDALLARNDADRAMQARIRHLIAQLG
jgi:HEAT repeat protein